MIEKADLEDEFEFILNCTDKDTLYKNLAFLLVPSRKESFGNSIVEALSYGVPVVAASYAPGPAEILEHGRSGFLLDDFSGTAVANALLSVDSDSLERMSSHAFERHKAFPIEKHGRQIEDLARSAVADFRGENTLPIFPKLRILEGTV